MNLPVLIILLTMMLSFFVVGVAALALSKGDWRVIAMALVLIGMGSLIAYGLGTQCANVDIYVYCGDE